MSAPGSRWVWLPVDRRQPSPATAQDPPQPVRHQALAPMDRRQHPPPTTQYPPRPRRRDRVWVPLDQQPHPSSSQDLPQPQPQPRRRNRNRQRVKPDQRRERKRNWAELPLDVLSAIFQKLRSFEILMGAGSVCRQWRSAAKEPALWRRIDMTYCSDILLQDFDMMMMMTRLAIGRSGGNLEAFWVEQFGTDELLLYVTGSTNSLKSLRLISCYNVSDDGLTEMAKRCPHLEELEVSYCELSEHVWESVGEACTQLKCFRFNNRAYEFPSFDLSDEGEADLGALGIAKHMHDLRHLQLFGNSLTNVGLRAILDSCPHLETLDIRQCFHITFDDVLRAKCVKIKILRLPHDSTDDYEFNAEVTGIGSSIDDNYMDWMYYDDDDVYAYDDDDGDEYDCSDIIDDFGYLGIFFGGDDDEDVDVGFLL